ncbi:MAG: DUF333 domain-containing protein [Alphaproteobacteria bacterium]|nr:DUF333 domain-containing protein [Alphaproteobacteria bacterium]
MRSGLLILCVLALAACAGPFGREVPNVPAEAVKLFGFGGATRAWCDDLGTDHELRSGADGKPVAFCVFPNGQACEAERAARGLYGPVSGAPRRSK